MKIKKVFCFVFIFGMIAATIYFVACGINLFQDQYIYGDPIYVVPNNAYAMRHPKGYEVEIEGILPDQMDFYQRYIAHEIDLSPNYFVYSSEDGPAFFSIPSGSYILNASYDDCGLFNCDPSASVLRRKVHEKRRIISRLDIETLTNVCLTEKYVYGSEGYDSDKWKLLERNQKKDLSNAFYQIVANRRYTITFNNLNVFPDANADHDVYLLDSKGLRSDAFSYFAEDGTFVVTKPGNYDFVIDSHLRGSISVPLIVKSNNAFDIGTLPSGEPASIENRKEVTHLVYDNFPDFYSLAALKYVFPNLATLEITFKSQPENPHPTFIPNHMPTVLFNDDYLYQNYSAYNPAVCLIGEDEYNTVLNMRQPDMFHLTNLVDASLFSNFKTLSFQGDKDTHWSRLAIVASGSKDPSKEFTLIDNVHELFFRSYHEVVVDATNDPRPAPHKGLSGIRADTLFCDNVLCLDVKGGNGSNGTISENVNDVINNISGGDSGFGANLSALRWELPQHKQYERTRYLHFYGGRGGDAGYATGSSAGRARGHSGTSYYGLRVRNVSFDPDEYTRVFITDYADTYYKSEYPADSAIVYETQPR